jgi:hypothetical protein
MKIEDFYRVVVIGVDNFCGKLYFLAIPSHYICVQNV